MGLKIIDLTLQLHRPVVNELTFTFNFSNVYHNIWILYIGFCVLNLNARGPSYLGLTSFLRRHDISSHDIDYVEYVGPGIT